MGVVVPGKKEKCCQRRFLSQLILGLREIHYQDQVVYDGLLSRSSYLALQRRNLWDSGYAMGRSRLGNSSDRNTLARPEGLEPPTTWFEARYSIQLSYGRVV